MRSKVLLYCLYSGFVFLLLILSAILKRVSLLLLFVVLVTVSLAVIGPRVLLRCPKCGERLNFIDLIELIAQKERACKVCGNPIDIETLRFNDKRIKIKLRNPKKRRYVVLAFVILIGLYLSHYSEAARTKGLLRQLESGAELVVEDRNYSILEKINLDEATFEVEPLTFTEKRDLVDEDYTAYLMDSRDDVVMHTDIYTYKKDWVIKWRRHYYKFEY